MADDDWIDVTRLGDRYQVQINSMSNQYRWRRISRPLPTPRNALLDIVGVQYEWQYGDRPPEDQV